MKHRDLAIIHSQNCVQQQDVVIAPGAPMARRLEYKQSRMVEKNTVSREYHEGITENLPHGYYVEEAEASNTPNYGRPLRLIPISKQPRLAGKVFYVPRNN